MTRYFERDVVTERLQMIVSDAWMKRVDEWRRKQPKIPSRSGAVRMLVSTCLDEVMRGKQGSDLEGSSPPPAE